MGAGLGAGFFAGVEIPMLIRKNLSPPRRDARMLIDSILSFHPFTIRFIDSSFQTLVGVRLAFRSIAEHLYGPVGACVEGAAGAVGALRRISSAAGGMGLLALARKMLTCHISSSLRAVLKEGMPVSRMPLATFQ